MKPVEQMTCEEVEDQLYLLTDRHINDPPIFEQIWALITELKSRRLAQSAG